MITLHESSRKTGKMGDRLSGRFRGPLMQPRLGSIELQPGEQ